MRYVIFSFIASLSLLISCLNTKHNCPYTNLSLIQTVRGCNGNECFYEHEVFSEGLYAECLDSLSVTKLVEEYVDNNIIDTPIHSIEIHDSKKGYDPGETLSQPSEYLNHRVLQIVFGNRYHKDIIFAFYKSGYEGTRWYP